MNTTLKACLLILSQALANCTADAATVMPIWQNDTVANAISFQDTFGHQITIGSYNPLTGGWVAQPGSIAGTAGGVLYFSSVTTSVSSGLLGAHQIVLGGGSGGAPATPVGLGTTTQLLHGNVSGAPSFGPIVSADVSTVLGSRATPLLIATFAGGPGFVELVNILLAHKFI